ncbi:LETM1 MRS7 family with a transmembrane region at the N-terminus [Cryptosporidium sp. chipmunk genotype I]|uniref:LETM1 MRS7 family with a transmembrane region at the N-terminus n=1 Tax=Cryptosporidium sp. chipmunk genotype I TaxID=1280935 RepID=UPI003519FCA4|nr:LETM1 MRS7 family with a transmembrane region at the N-terminus [Cryptosporidium sp. chipmunk genotype I]
MIRFKTVVERIKGKSYLKSFNHSLKEGFNWSIRGFKLFFFNIKCSNSLIQKRILGNELTFNEKQLVKTTIKDAVKILPFSFFIVVPFAEFGLPFAIKLFPNMLPSTFALKSIKEREENMLCKNKFELLKFHSLINNIISDLKKSDDSNIISGVNSLETIQRELLKSKELDQEELRKVISGPVKEKFELENLNIETLQSISRIMGIPLTRNKFLLMLRIRHRMLKLKNEDKDILWDGTDQVNKEQLQKVLASRLIDHNKIEHGIEECNKLLMSWIRLSSMKRLPLSVILWIQITKLICNNIDKL